MFRSRSVQRSPLPWKLLAVAFIFLGITAISVAMTFAAIAVQSAVRSYVAGEGYWSKAQRDAAFSLYRYGQTGDREYLRRFEESVAVPLGDRSARLELEKPESDRAVAVQGFLDGGNHPADVPSLIWLYRCCHRLPQLQRTITYWRGGDAHILEMQAVARELQREIESAWPSEIRISELLTRVEDLNDSVHPLEAAFTESLGETARQVSTLLMAFTLGTVFILVLLGTYLTLRIVRSVRSSEEQYRTLMQGASDGLIVIDTAKGLVREVNQYVERMIGRPANELIGVPWDSLFDAPVARPPVGAQQPAAQQAGLRTAGGGVVAVEVKCSATTWGDRPALLAILRDVSERLAVERQLRIATNAMENMTEAVVITDPRFQVVSVNGAFTAITGYTQAEVIGKVPAYLNMRAGDTRKLRRIVRALQRDGRWQGELNNVRKNGEAYPMRLSLASVPAEDGSIAHYVGIFSDNSAFRDYENRLKHLANHDMLTQLPNRAAFEEASARAIGRAAREGQRLALLFVDLDGFKPVNDNYGHTVGDHVLRTVSRRICDCLRATDLVARVGGDEFNVLLSELADERDAARLARTLLAAISEPIACGGHVVSLSASIGLSFYPDDATEFEALVTHADMAMYEAKGRGRNNFQVFSAQVSIAARTRLALVNGLRHAIERDQLHLQYQPYTDLASGRLLGVEALLRWSHPELGQVGPDRFIPLAEEIGVIDAISDWVLRTACAQAARWRADGLGDITMAVNLSPRNFWDPEMPGRVAGIIAETGWPASLLCLEITEGTIMGQQDPEASLQRLADLGVRLAVDDFGIGYSSLGSLRRFPVDILKIDRSFTQGIPENGDNLALVHTIISLGANLGLTVVAEGVETSAQHRTLLEAGCAQGQGYLYGKPMAAVEVEALLRGARISRDAALIG